jgi:hypothetical protein
MALTTRAGGGYLLDALVAQWWGVRAYARSHHDGPLVLAIAWAATQRLLGLAKKDDRARAVLHGRQDSWLRAVDLLRKRWVEQPHSLWAGAATGGGPTNADRAPLVGDIVAR